MTNATAERVFDALGDRTRRAVFLRLRGGARSVTDLADGMHVTRPAVSQHLRVLLDAGLVGVRPVGTRRLYHADPRALSDLRAYFTSFWSQALAAFAAAVDEEEQADDGIDPR